MAHRWPERQYFFCNLHQATKLSRNKIIKSQEEESQSTSVYLHHKKKTIIESVNACAVAYGATGRISQAFGMSVLQGSTGVSFLDILPVAPLKWIPVRPLQAASANLLGTMRKIITIFFYHNI